MGNFSLPYPCNIITEIIRTGVTNQAHWDIWLLFVTLINRYLPMKKFLFFFAVTGWILAVTAHLLSLADYDVNEQFPFVWILHVGIFIVWIPTVLNLKKNEELKELKLSGANQRAFLKAVFKNTPAWMTVIAIAGMLFAVANFMLFMFDGARGVALIRNGQYVLDNHGQVIKTLTLQEYNHQRASHIRGFSGHWIAFYGIAAALSYPFGKQTMDAQIA
jgi:hypothetical protein